MNFNTEVYEKAFYKKILELCIAQTFAQIRIQTDEIDLSSDTDDIKIQKKNRVLGMAKWGFKLQNDLDQYNLGEKTYVQLNDITKNVMNKQIDALVSNGETFVHTLRMVDVLLLQAQNTIRM